MSKLINTDFFLKVSTGKNLYALDITKFNAYILEERTGTITQITAPFSEIINPITSVSSTLSTNIEGSTNITIADGSLFKDGDVVQIDSSFYYIESIVGNTLTILKPSDLHVAGTTVTTVGNTGIYKVLLNLPNVGEYTAFVNNPSINMQNFSTGLVLDSTSTLALSEQINTLNDEIIRSSFI